MSIDESKSVEDKQEDNSRLVEYQACQQSINSSGANYWSMAGIFIGFSTLLLGGVIFGIIPSQILLENSVNTISKQVLVLQCLVTVVGLGMLFIYYVLWRWLMRVRYLQQQDYRRMREIELKLWMRKSLVIKGIDDWEGLGKEEQERLRELNLEEECKEQKNKKEYEIPTSKWFFKYIIGVQMFLWGITILSVWIVPAVLNCTAI